MAQKGTALFSSLVGGLNLSLVRDANTAMQSLETAKVEVPDTSTFILAIFHLGSTSLKLHVAFASAASVVEPYVELYPNTCKARITDQHKVVSLYVKHVYNVYIYTYIHIYTYTYAYYELIMFLYVGMNIFDIFDVRNVEVPQTSVVCML